MNASLHTRLTATLCLAYGAATLSSLVAAAASAAELEPLPTRTVKYADLNLSNPAGVQALYGRIIAAARQVCQLDTHTDLHLLGKEQACMKQAIDDAVRKVNSPALADLRFGSTHLASR
jgi:UrcA family protein